MIAGLLQLDTSSGERWLSFTRPPPPEIRGALITAGWLYNGGLRAWRHADPAAPVPAGVRVGHGGACAYSDSRPRSGLEVLALLSRTRTSIQRRTQSRPSSPRSPP
jgi:hypothetical protein